MKPTHIPKWIPYCVVLCAALSLVSLAYRHKVEAANKAVEISAEYEAVEMLAASEGLRMEQAIAQLKEVGLTSITLSEDLVSQAESDGKIELIPSGVRLLDPSMLAQMERAIEVRFPDKAGALIQTDDILQIPGLTPTLIRSLSLGLNQEKASVVNQSGLTLIARAANPLGATPETVQKTLEWLHDDGADVFLPFGDQVLGRRDSVETFTETIKALDMNYATAEFAKINGDANVVAKIPERTIRLHAAQAAEMDRLTEAAAVERYSKAARERNIRILLVRPQNSSAERPLSDFGDLIQKIRVAVEKDGGAAKTARPFTEPGVPTWLFVLIGLSVAPVAYFVGSCFFTNTLVLRLGVVGSALIPVLAAVGAGRPYAALIASIIFPILAFIILERREGKHWIIEVAIVTLISLVGGLAVSGLLNGLPYLIQSKQFMGVKVQHFLPILVVGYYLYSRLSDVNTGLKIPVTWGRAFLAIGMLVLLLLIISRTGNDNPAAVSGLELKLRSLLDTLLPVRPRTKEFLIGHPALVLGVGMLMSMRRSGQGNAGWVTLVLTLSALGQTSIVNTLCHQHTPISLGLLRIATGLVTGVILGAIILSVYRYTTSREAAQ